MNLIHLLNNPFLTWVSGVAIGSWSVSLTRDVRAWRHPTQVKRPPRVRIRQDGWVVHRPGPFPFLDRCLVQVQFADGSRASGDVLDLRRPSDWCDAWWRGQASPRRHNIVAFRIAECQP